MKRRSFRFNIKVWLSLLALCSLWLPVTVALGHQAAAITTVWALAWHPNGSVLAVGVNLGGTGTGIQFFDFAADKTTWIETSGNVLSLSWSPDGTMLAGCLASSPGYLYLVWDATTLAQLLTVEQETELDCLSISWNLNSNQIAFPGNYNVSIWDVKSAKQVASLAKYESNAESVDGVAWHPDGTRLLVAQHTVIRIWDVPSQNVVQEYPISDVTDSTILSLVMSPTGEHFAVGTGKGSVLIFNTDTGELTDTLRTQDMSEGIFFLDWSPLGDQIADAGYSGPITIWNLQNKQVEDTFPVDIYSLKDIQFSPYGGRLAYGKIQRDVAAGPLSGKGQSLFEGAARIVIVAPSFDRLNTISGMCVRDAGTPNVPLATLTAQAVTESTLPDFIASVQALPDNAIPSACRVDLLAVAEALQSGN